MSRICCDVKVFTVYCPYCGKTGKNDKDDLSFGDKLKLWDNDLDNTIGNFNKIFDQVVGGNQKDELIIGLPFTHLGRILTRTFDDDTELEYQFIFDDEISAVQGSPSDQVIDTFDKSTGKFLHTYRHTSTLARDFQVDVTSARAWLKDDKHCPVNLKIRKLK